MTTLTIILLINFSVLVLLHFCGDKRNIESRIEREEKILKNQK